MFRVRRRHVDLRAQHVRAVRKLARAHARKQIEALLDRAGRGTDCCVPAPSTCRDSRRISSRRQTVDVGLVAPDELHGEAVAAARSSPDANSSCVPRETEPRDVFLDGVDVLDVFLRGIGVVEPEVAGAAVLLRRRRSSDKSIWRVRYADSRSARAESGSRPARGVCPSARSSSTIARMKSTEAAVSGDTGFSEWSIVAFIL